MIELTQNQIDILGRPNFACAGLASLLVSKGIYKKPVKVRAESEQAIAIHFLSQMLEKHGDEWRKETDKYIHELHVKADSAGGGE